MNHATNATAHPPHAASYRTKSAISPYEASLLRADAVRLRAPHGRLIAISKEQTRVIGTLLFWGWKRAT